EFHEVVQNAEWLHRLFAAEKGFTYSRDTILSDYIRHFRPEILYLDTVDLPIGWISDLKSDFPFIKLIVLFNCSPGNEHIHRLMKECDFVIACHGGLKNDYEAAGLNCVHIYH